MKTLLCVSLCVSCIRGIDIPIDEDIDSIPYGHFDVNKFGYTWEMFMDMYDKQDDDVFQTIKRYYPTKDTQLNKKEYRAAMLVIAYKMPVLNKDNYGGSSYWNEIDRLFRRYLNFISDYKTRSLHHVYDDLFSPNPSKWHVKDRDVTVYDDEAYHGTEAKPVPPHDAKEFDL